MSKLTNQLTTCADYAAKLADDLLTPATAAKEYAASLELTTSDWMAYELNPASLSSEAAVLLYQRKASLQALVDMFDERKVSILQHSIRETAYVSQVEGRVAALKLLLAGKVLPRASFVAGLKTYLIEAASKFYEPSMTHAERVILINQRDIKEAEALAADEQVFSAEQMILTFEKNPCPETYNWAVGGISVIDFA